LNISHFFFLDDAFKLTVDRVFNEFGGNECGRMSQFKVNGYSDCVNLWECLGSLASNKKSCRL